jgi:hypothetical protein
MPPSIIPTSGIKAWHMSRRSKKWWESNYCQG